MFRSYRMLINAKTRRSLWWNLKRVWVEHQYSEELSRLSSLVDTDQYYLAKRYAEALRKASPYLEPELIRFETLVDFLTP